MSEQREFVIDIDDQRKAGCYRDFESTVRGSVGVFVEKDGAPLKFRLVRAAQVDDRPWDDVNTDGASVSISVNDVPILPPTGGTFDLTYNGNAVGLSNIPYNVSAAVLQVTLNANAVILGAGGVTVELLATGKYRIAHNTNNVTAVWGHTDTKLRPRSQVVFGELQAASADAPLVNSMELERLPYALLQSPDITGIADGSVTVSNRQTGTATKKSVQRIVFSASIEPYEGSLIVNFDRPNITRVPCTNNKGEKQKWRGGFIADVGGASHLLYDDFYDKDGPVRIYWNNGSGGAPAIPVGGRLLSVTFANDDDAETMAINWQTAVEADTQFTATPGPSTIQVTWEDVNRGARNDISYNGTGIVWNKLIAGTNGPLSQKTFKVFDSAGSVGVWFGLTGAEVPAAAAACDRNIQAVVTANDTNANVATALNTVADADAAFSSIIVSGTQTVEITDITGGVRPESEDIDTGLGITNPQTGKSFTAQFEFDADEQSIEDQFNGYFHVIRRQNGNIEFRANNVGPQPALTVDASPLSFPNVLEGTLILSTESMLVRFLETSEDFIDLILEMKIEFVGQPPYTFYRELVRVYRTALDLSNISPTPFPGQAGYVGLNYRIKSDGTFQLLNTETDLWHTITVVGPDGAASLSCTLSGEV